MSLDAVVTDPDLEDTLMYSWSHNSTLMITLDDIEDPSFVAPNVDEDTAVEFTLTVDDGTVSVPDTMTVTIRDSSNTPPSVDAGPDQTVKEGVTVSMPWTASDPDGDPLTYSWSQSPAQPAISLISPNSSPTTFTAPQVDDDAAFTFALTVTAGPHIVEDYLTITVQNNRPPTVDAGKAVTVSEGATVTLSGSANDPNDDLLVYEWVRVSGPILADLIGGNTTSPQFTAPGVASDEDIVFRFTATDDSDEYADDTVTVTVRNVPITVSSATYNSDSGTLLITFDQDIEAVDYSKLRVRSANPDTGSSITFSGADSKEFSERTITMVLSSDMREMYADLISPHLVVEDGAVTDTDGDQTTGVPDRPISDVSKKKSSSSKAPLVNMIALAQARIADIPPHIAKQVASHDGSDPLEPLVPDGTFDLPLVINGYGYLLDDSTNTLVPQTLTAGNGPVTVTFTVYTEKDLAHFTLYLNLSDGNTDYADSDTYITYTSDGATVVTDPHGYIAGAAITVTQEDDQVSEKKTVSITVEFDEPMGLTNAVAYMWNTDRKAAFVRVIDAFEVVTLPPPQEPVMQAADPEPVEPGSELPADPEPVAAPDLADDDGAADHEPAFPDALRPADDYDDAHVLTLIRMWSGFESEMITDEQLIELLGLDEYLGTDLPDWMMTDLGVLVSNGDVTVDEFMLALQYVLEHV